MQLVTSNTLGNISIVCVSIITNSESGKCVIKNAPLPGLEVRLTRDVQISVDLSFSSRVPGEALEDSGIAGLYLPDLKAHAGDDLVARVA